MACGDPIPPERTIYRALSWSKIDKKTNEPKDKAFLLKPAHDHPKNGILTHFDDETYLSFGITPEAAREGLGDVPRVCEIRVVDILALGHGLQVTEDPDPQKVCVSGMPLLTANESLALTIAKDLRRKSRICP